ncbi:MAG: hypothetical protein HKN20_13380, partial [Gemmatimonadetes bacterium]|nr:hypothetical protein [Gemmatimonadota bacterium]
MSRIDSTGAANPISAQGQASVGTPEERLEAALNMKVPKGDRQATRLRLGAIFRVLNSLSTKEANGLFNKIMKSGHPLRELVMYKLSKPMQQQVFNKVTDIAIMEVRRPVKWEKMWPLNKDEVALLDKKQTSLAKAMAPRPKPAFPSTPSQEAPAAGEGREKSLADTVRDQVAATKAELKDAPPLGDVVRDQMAKTKDEIENPPPLGDVIRDQVAATKAELEDTPPLGDVVRDQMAETKKQVEDSEK